MIERIKEELIQRRALLIAPFAFAGLIAIASRRGASSAPVNPGEDVTIVEFDDAGKRTGDVRTKRVFHSDAEWRKMLTAQQYYVTRKQSTDTPFTGTYYRTHDAGLFRCICCGNALFSSETKFDSGTGWPSFWAPIAEENVRTKKDTSLFMERVEVTCQLCDAHLGHLFNDGPDPTGLRYCMNESSLRLIPARL